MRPSLHSHASHEDVNVYHSLSQHQSKSAQPAYPPFPNSLDHVDTNEHNTSNYGAPAPRSVEQQHTLPSQHNHIAHNPHNAHNGGHLDPTYSLARHDAEEQHDFSGPSNTTGNPEILVLPPPPIVPNTAPDGDFDMLPPPPSKHPSWQALHEYAQTHAATHGYALSINTTSKSRTRIKLACVCYGKPKNTHKLTPETRVRKNRVSYKTGCKMWIEGKKLDDGSWNLRIGNGGHNHPGRATYGWSLQRKRTWGAHGGKVGIGGVTAREEQEQERERSGTANHEQPGEQDEEENADVEDASRTGAQSHEKGSLVWKIVEQQMLRKGGPRQGRDRGVGRTVKILEEKLPGIHIFKRDVYNIRAQIRRARRASGQQIGDGLDTDIEEELAEEDRQREAEEERQRAAARPRQIVYGNADGSQPFSQIDPTLVAQCNSALQNMPNPNQNPNQTLNQTQNQTRNQNQSQSQEDSEVDKLRREVDVLKSALGHLTKQLSDKETENEGLRVQIELANIAMYNNVRNGQ